MKSSLTHEDLVEVHDYWVNRKTREIWIHGVETRDVSGEEPGVEYMMATRVIKNLHLLKDMDRDKEVVVHLHTCGGVWEEGMAIYDTIKSMPYHVTIISYTHARSMSSIILQAADERVLMPSSYFMFHYGSLEVGGHPLQVQSEVDFSRLCDDKMIQIYVDAIIKSGSEKFD